MSRSQGEKAVWRDAKSVCVAGGIVGVADLRMLKGKGKKESPLPHPSPRKREEGRKEEEGMGVGPESTQHSRKTRREGFSP